MSDVSRVYAGFRTPAGEAYFRTDAIVGCRDLAADEKCAFGGGSVALLLVGTPDDFIGLPIQTPAADALRVLVGVGR